MLQTYRMAVNENYKEWRLKANEDGCFVLTRKTVKGR